MPSTDFYLKTDQFLAAIAEYAEGLGKDFAYSVNRQMRNAALKARALAPVADRAAIERYRTPQFAAWALSRKPKERVRAKYRRYTGKLGKNWNKKYKTYYRFVWRHYSRQDAKKYLKSVIGRRLAARTFVQSFFGNFVKVIQEKTPGLDHKPPKAQKRGFTPGYIPATPENPMAYGTVQYQYRHSRRSKAAVDRRLEETWIRGMDEAQADMLQYLRDQLAKRAAAHSVKS